MRSAYAAVPLALALRAAATTKDSWAFGNGFYSGPATNAHITKATWSLVPPTVPQGVEVQDSSDQVWVSLWIGLQHTNGDDSSYLYQPLLNWSPDQESQGCPATAEEWCVAASTYTPSHLNLAHIDVSCIQYLTYTIIDLDAELLYLYSGDECYTGSGNCGTLEAYSWNNITIHLSAEDEKFGDTLFLYKGSNSSGFTTSDGGKTWHAESINIEQDSWTGA
ncbi:hypothetical protein AO1008_09930 [Aspergillus oryzae 100-8]|uniref:Uncharacterized protein n=1 Tax=Aspergillus oryzae (strain 3.042) TaxID=1160506 RepID=I8AC96_ASPO3|nr:hypothetical protein Ao3042_11671 [Aspergillus oryzae 3.042]KDE83446.1 hypothetical protein AO1008_09930 [Aspergillus oryzae 100-8]|eukprot:EIT83082.1 hypothetical protein Ao3042_11671 [Aspergillus oryzae 3.042]